MNNTHELGALKSKHAPSKAFIYTSIAIFIIFSALSAIIYFGAIRSVERGESNFSGDLSILYWAIVFIMVLGFGMVVLAFSLSKGKTYELYENGIIIDDKGDRKIRLIKDVEDLYLFSSGKTYIINNIAFRNRTENQWEVITVRYQKVSRAFDFLTERHELIHLPEMLKELQKGNGVTFQYISYSAAFGRKLLATGTKSFLKVQPKELIVYKDHLRIEGENILISDLNRFTVNNWISKINLLDKNNKVVFSTSTSGIFSGNTFVALMDELINKTT